MAEVTTSGDRNAREFLPYLSLLRTDPLPQLAQIKDKCRLFRHTQHMTVFTNGNSITKRSIIDNNSS